MEHQIPITSSSVFNVASLSKQFTAACIAHLILYNKLTLEDKIAPYFPNLPDHCKELQIKHLIYMAHDTISKE